MRNFLLKIVYILLWPLVFVYAPLVVRSRIMVIKNGKYLGVRHYFGSNTWSLPGGGVKRGESYKDAAIRELYEELGLVVSVQDVHDLLDVRTYNEGGHFMRYALFVVVINNDIELKLNHEISETRWLTANASSTSNHVKQAVHQAVGRGYLLK